MSLRRRPHLHLQPWPEPRIFRLLPDTATISPEGILHIANHSVPYLAHRYGTPLYIFECEDTKG